MRDLSKRYGKDKPFKDNELFDTIAAMTYPEIRVFFQNYVEGAEPLPLKNYLEKAGITFDEKKRTLRPAQDATPGQLQLRKWWAGQ
ncbi:MAG: hypothetical protein IPJ82_07265 [Lewinellaceae bacterium]|nr:hypothetical protein [Lewinellaceae bacterium]